MGRPSDALLASGITVVTHLCAPSCQWLIDQHGYLLGYRNPLTDANVFFPDTVKWKDEQGRRIYPGADNPLIAPA